MNIVYEIPKILIELYSNYRADQQNMYWSLKSTY